MRTIRWDGRDSTKAARSVSSPDRQQVRCEESSDAGPVPAMTDVHYYDNEQQHDDHHPVSMQSD
jgi:hypothetical protein